MRAALVLLLALPGCYAPHVEPGAYLCAMDGACPDGLTCVCGQCVHEDREAACSFEFEAPDKKDEGNLSVKSFTVAEHERFRLVLHAKQKDPTKDATGFRGAVKLSSTWGDVCVGSSGCIVSDGPHDRIQLVNGVGDDVIQLNRETIYPTSALLRAEIGSAVGTSDQMQILVDGPAFIRELGDPVVRPLRVGDSYGPLVGVASYPAVVNAPDGWRMYLIGGVKPLSAGRSAIAVATSTDGKTFTPQSDSVYEYDGLKILAGPLSAHQDGTLMHLYAASYPDVNTRAIIELTSASSLGGFSLADAPVLSFDRPAGGGCVFCGTLVPGTVASHPAPGSGATDRIDELFFSSLKNFAGSNVSLIGRAVRKNDESFVADPAPLLAPIESEPIIFSPLVVVDGTTYKMFYTFSDTLPDEWCAKNSPAKVGYATSADGHFWIRSPRNETGLFTANPDTTTWEGGAPVAMTSIVPKDGHDPSNGWALYYTVLLPAGMGCLPNGVGRATAP